MSEETFYISVVGEEEHEDGSATYSFDLDEKAQKSLIELGLKFVVYCAAYRLDIQEVFDHIAWMGAAREKETDDE